MNSMEQQPVFVSSDRMRFAKLFAELRRQFSNTWFLIHFQAQLMKSQSLCELKKKKFKLMFIESMSSFL